MTSKHLLDSERDRRRQLEQQVVLLKREAVRQEKERAAQRELTQRTRQEAADRAWQLECELAKLEAILPGEKSFEEALRATQEDAARRSELERQRHQARAATVIQAHQRRRHGKQQTKVLEQEARAARLIVRIAERILEQTAAGKHPRASSARPQQPPHPPSSDLLAPGPRAPSTVRPLSATLTPLPPRPRTATGATAVDRAAARERRVLRSAVAKAQRAAGDAVAPAPPPSALATAAAEAVSRLEAEQLARQDLLRAMENHHAAEAARRLHGEAGKKDAAAARREEVAAAAARRAQQATWRTAAERRKGAAADEARFDAALRARRTSEREARESVLEHVRRAAQQEHARAAALGGGSAALSFEEEGAEPASRPLSALKRHPAETAAQIEERLKQARRSRAAGIATNSPMLMMPPPTPQPPQPTCRPSTAGAGAGAGAGARPVRPQSALPKRLASAPSARPACSAQLRPSSAASEYGRARQVAAAQKALLVARHASPAGSFRSVSSSSRRGDRTATPKAPQPRPQTADSAAGRPQLERLGYGFTELFQSREWWASQLQPAAAAEEGRPASARPHTASPRARRQAAQVDERFAQIEARFAAPPVRRG